MKRIRSIVGCLAAAIAMAAMSQAAHAMDFHEEKSVRLNFGAKHFSMERWKFAMDDRRYELVFMGDQNERNIQIHKINAKTAQKRPVYAVYDHGIKTVETEISQILTSEGRALLAIKAPGGNAYLIGEDKNGQWYTYFADNHIDLYRLPGDKKFVARGGRLYLECYPNDANASGEVRLRPMASYGVDWDEAAQLYRIGREADRRRA